MSFGVIFYGLTALAAAFILLILAEPHRFFPVEKPKKRKVGSTYWGVYLGASPDEPESEQTIEIQKPMRKDRPIYGSTTYAQGRGVDPSGRR